MEFSVNLTLLKDFKVTTSEENPDIICLDKGPIACYARTAEAKWENRSPFLARVISDIFTYVSKEEEICLISFGSYKLFSESIIGQTIIPAGYHKVSFLFVDLVYKYSSTEQLAEIYVVFQEFTKRISACYKEKFHSEFPKERIQFLSSAQSVAKYFIKGAKVVILESLPPYGAILKGLEEKRAKKIDPEDLFAGSTICSPEVANAVVCVPRSHLPATLFPENSSLPQGLAPESNIYTNWGCKIGESGMVRHLFITQEVEVLTRSHTSSPFSQVKSQFEDQLAKLKLKKPDTRERKTAYLKTFAEQMKHLIPTIRIFYLMDYRTDRRDLLTFLFQKASKDYLKSFIYRGDPVTTYKIEVEDLSQASPS